MAVGEAKGGISSPQSNHESSMKKLLGADREWPSPESGGLILSPLPDPPVSTTSEMNSTPTDLQAERWEVNFR